MSVTEPVTPEVLQPEVLQPDQEAVIDLPPPREPAAVHSVSLQATTDRTIPGSTTSIVPLRDEYRGLVQTAIEFATSNLVPAPLRGKPADVFLVLLTGRDLGIPMTTAIRTLHVINGTVTLPPKLRLALVKQKGLGRVWPDPSNGRDGATWYAERADQRGDIFSSTVTWEDACQVTFEEWTGDGNNRRKVKKAIVEKENWQNYPARMLSWRALGYLLDDAFPDVGTGLYSPDEMGAVTDEDGTVIDVYEATPNLPSEAEVRRRINHGPASRNAEPAAPDDPPPTDEWMQATRDRIAALTPGRRAWFTQQWQAKGKSVLPPLAECRLRHTVMIDALLVTAERMVDATAPDPWPAGQEGPSVPADGPQADDVPGDSGEGAQGHTAPSPAPVSAAHHIMGLTAQAVLGLAARWGVDHNDDDAIADVAEAVVYAAEERGWLPWHDQNLARLMASTKADMRALAKLHDLPWDGSGSSGDVALRLAPLLIEKGIIL